jgi:hypothetical protein
MQNSANTATTNITTITIVKHVPEYWHGTKYLTARVNTTREYALEAAATFLYKLCGVVG